MFKLLNRLSYLISFIMWFIISLVFISVDSGSLWTDDIIGSIFFWIFAWLVFKKLFLSSDYIDSRLQFFAKSLTKLETHKNHTKTIAPIVTDTSFEEDDSVADEINIQEQIELKDIEEIIYKTSTIDAPAIDAPAIKKVHEIHEKPSEPSKFEIAFKNFFAENLLAKLGGILVFLGVLFLLISIYSVIWAVWKLIIWFGIWFAIYFSWVLLEKKGYTNEWIILLGIWILINYLVILWWRYLIWDTVDNSYLSIWTTFAFLILNTLFAVVTSLVYKSRTLLLFSFIFAFINPILIWWSSDNPYTLVWYSLIVAIWWLFLSLKQKDILLAIWVFILWNILILNAPISSDFHWIITLSSSAILSISSIYTVYKLDSKQLSWMFLWSYIFLVLLLWNGDIYLKETTSFISYMVTIVLYFAIWIYFFLKTSFNSIAFLMFSPILIVLWLCFTWVLINITIVLALIVFVYLVWFVFVKDRLPEILKYFFFVVLWIYIFLTNSFLAFQPVQLELANFITVIIVSFVFIFSSYYLSTKKDLEFLYSIWTIWWILTLAPIIVSKFSFIDLWTITNSAPSNILQFYLSVLALTIFALSNWFLPFLNPPIPNPFPPREKGDSPDSSTSIKNLLIWVITGLLFIWFELFNYWTEYFPWVTLWGSFAILAIIYFILAYFMLNKIWIETIKKQEYSKNVLYTYLWVSISIFSLAIALIFSNYESVISAIWLFEATLMFYFFYKTKELKIFIAWIILFMIWIVSLSNLINIVKSNDFIFLTPFTLIFISFVYNIKFLDSEKSWVTRGFHDILHIWWMVILWILLLEIIPSTWHGWSTIWIAIFLLIVNFVYSYFNSNILKVFFIFIFTSFLMIQVEGLKGIYLKIDNEKIWFLRTLQYTSTLIIWIIVILWNKINKAKSFSFYINIIFSFYLLIITTQYIYDIFDTTFAVTIYWWVTASILIFYGIAKDIIKYRTVWLYLVSLTSLKIFLYDVWFWIDNAFSRVIAFIVIWILLIIISTRYTKKYWNNLKWEFKFSNFSSKKDINNITISSNNIKSEVKSSNDKSEIKSEWQSDLSFLVNQRIKDIDVSEYRWIKFYINEWSNFEIRAENVIKIIKMVTNDFKDNSFEKWELKDTYEFVIKNYKTELSKATYDKIIIVLSQFVEEWWRIEAILKK